MVSVYNINYAVYNNTEWNDIGCKEFNDEIKLYVYKIKLE